MFALNFVLYSFWINCKSNIDFILNLLYCCCGKPRTVGDSAFCLKFLAINLNHVLLKFKAFLSLKETVLKLIRIDSLFCALSDIEKYTGLWKQNWLYWHNINNLNTLRVVILAEKNRFISIYLQIPEISQDREKLAVLWKYRIKLRL